MNKESQQTSTANQLNQTPPSSKLRELLRQLSVSDRKEKRQFEKLENQLAEYLGESELDLVRDSFEVAAGAHEGQVRINREKYISHPLAVAQLLADLKLDSHTIVAAILHDTIEDTHLTRDYIESKFGKEVAILVDGVSKVTGSEFKDKEDEEAENVRRLLIASADDIRVILIKLADRMHNLESLDVHRLEKRKRIVRQTREIYIPMTYMLGMYEWHRQLEDLCFKAIYPNRYQTISNELKKSVKDRTAGSINRLVNAIKKNLNDHGLHAEVAWRQKNVAAIHEKMRHRRESNKSISFAAIKDLVGIRVMLGTEDECYRALGIIHKHYTPIMGEFNDYIAVPKTNGYRSLHTSVHDQKGKVVEIQIRTHEMHAIAEYGIASYVSYKSKVRRARIRTVEEVPWLRELLDQAGDHNDRGREFLDNLKRQLFFDSVIVVTPQGERMRLKRGSTVIDFAYAIHTELGNQAKSATIGGERVPLHTVLEDGDLVEIKKRPLGKPDPRWEKFVVTAKAKMAIRRALKDTSDDDYVRMGERLFRKALKEMNYKTSAVTDELKEGLAKKLGVDGWRSILLQIGKGQRYEPVVVTQLFAEPAQDGANLDPSNGHMPVSIDGTEGVVVQYAKCCNPIPDDSIVGFRKAGGGIVMHISDCNNARKSKLPPEKWQRFYWTESPEGVYRVAVRVEAEERGGLLAELTAAIWSVKATNIEDCRVAGRTGTAITIEFLIDVANRYHLAQVVRKIRKLDEILHIERIRLA